MKQHLKSYGLWYLLAAIVIVVVVAMNWTTIKGWFSSSSTPGASGRIANKTVPVTQKTDCIGGYESVWGVIGSNARKCKSNGDGTYTYI